MAKYSPLTREQRLAEFYTLAAKNYDPNSLYDNPSKQSTYQIPGFDYDAFSSLPDPDPLKGIGVLTEERAQNQSWYDKVGNAALKMGITAGITFLDNTAGLLAGAVNVAGGGSFIDNPLSNFFTDIQDMGYNPNEINVVKKGYLIRLGINPFDSKYWEQ